MSLLLDALKRAEQEKLARQGEASNDPVPSGRAAESAAPGAGGMAGAALELQPIASAQASAAAARNENAAHTAHVVFQAKSGGENTRNRGMLWATLGAIAIVVSAAGAYVWYQIRVLSPNAPVVSARRAPPAPLPPAASGSPPPTTPLEESAVPVASLQVEPGRAGDVKSVAPRAPAPAATPAPRSNTEPLLASLAREAAAPVPAPAPLKLERTAETVHVPASVSTGYDALRNGDVATARRSYQAALDADPMNIDALLGMATVQARLDNPMLAASNYRRALQIDPRNATALAGLAALADASAPQRVETQLREDIARFPDSAALHFALGSHYAAQQRWGEAQASFYDAYRLDPTSGDIAYNLAISLDHMGQPRLAADFYRRAMESSRNLPAQFDPAAIRRRLAELSPR